MKRVVPPEIPTFVMHELLIRLSAVDPRAGQYVSHKLQKSGSTVQTTTGIFQFPMPLLRKQLADPNLISDEEIRLLLKSHKESSFIPNSIRRKSEGRL